MPYPPSVQAKLVKSAHLPSPPVLLISEARLHGILDAIRTTVLEWALRLEEQGVIGDGLSFSDADRKAASHMVFNIGLMSHSQIQADAAGSQQHLISVGPDNERILALAKEIRASLPRLSLGKAASDELTSELGTLEAQSKSPKPKHGIIKESLRSVRTILEGAAGNAVAEGLLHTVRILIR
jgi:hypothetical protein